MLKDSEANMARLLVNSYRKYLQVVDDAALGMSHFLLACSPSKAALRQEVLTKLYATTFWAFDRGHVGIAPRLTSHEASEGRHCGWRTSTSIALGYVNVYNNLGHMVLETYYSMRLRKRVRRGEKLRCRTARL